MLVSFLCMNIFYHFTILKLSYWSYVMRVIECGQRGYCEYDMCACIKERFSKFVLFIVSFCWNFLLLVRFFVIFFSYLVHIN